MTTDKEPRGIFADEGFLLMQSAIENGVPLDEDTRTEVLGENLGSIVGTMQFLQELRAPEVEIE